MNTRIHRYGCTLRPPMLGALPRQDFLGIEQHPAFFYGVVTYAEALSPEDCYRFDLTPVREDDDLPAVALAVEKEMAGYLPRYFEPGKEQYLDGFLSMERVRRVVGYVEDRAKLVEALRTLANGGK